MPNLFDDTEEFGGTPGAGAGNSLFGSLSGAFKNVTAGSVASGIGGIFGAIGDFQEGAAYGQAAKIAQHNEYLSTLQGKIEQSQAQRQVNLVSGQEGAAYTSGGLALSGSAAAVMRNTAQQGALEHAIIGMKAGAQSEGYLQQSEQFKKMARMANIAGVGGLIGGIASFFGI